MSIQCTGKIGDFVFKDANCDGNQTGDTGIPNVIVHLKQGNAIIASTTTDVNGHYEFDGLCLGEYVVEVDATSLPVGYTPTTCSNTPGIGDNSNCSPSTVILTANNTEDFTIDFGYCVPPPPCTGKVGDFVWKDNNCNGTQEGGDLGAAGSQDPDHGRPAALLADPAGAGPGQVVRGEPQRARLTQCCDGQR